MVKKEKCPVCEVGVLNVEVQEGDKVVFSGNFKQLPCKVYCKNCKRFIKYKTEKAD